MSGNRTFDYAFFYKRRQDLVNSRNQYLNNVNGQRIIFNPQLSDWNASRQATFVDGAQTMVFRGTYGNGENINVGGTVNIPPYPQEPVAAITAPAFAPVAPPAPAPVAPPAPAPVAPAPAPVAPAPVAPAPVAPAPVAPAPSFSSPTITYILSSSSGAYVYFNAGSGTPTNYEYTTDDGTTINILSPADSVSPIYIPGLTNGTTENIKIRAVIGSDISSWSNTLSVIPDNSTIPGAWLMFDPNNSSSYSGTGASVNNIGSYGTLTGTKGASVAYQDDTTISRKIFNFSGLNGNANVITFPQFNFGTQISVTAWINPRLKNDINGLLVNTTANVAPSGFKLQWNTWQSNSRVIGMQAGNGSQGGDNYTVTNTINYGEWQHIGYVFDQANRIVIFFKNGVPIDILTSVTPVANIGINQAFNIGGYIGGSYTMNANLGYIKVFNTLLNATQILDEFNNTKSQFGL